jgi:hypothetical protein
MQMIIDKYQDYVHKKQCNKQNMFGKTMEFVEKIMVSSENVTIFSANYIGAHECMNHITLGRAIVKTW